MKTLRCVINMHIFCLVLLQFVTAKSPNPQVILETSEGFVTLELYSDAAPKTVENFLAYVKSGLYDGTIFHRVIKGFMIQGGGFTSDMTQKPTQGPIQNEADNGKKNEPGTVAMARTNAPHSATSQFFINTVDNAFLNHKDKKSQWGYCVFGKVINGMKVVTAIENKKTSNKAGHSNVPLIPIIIKNVKLVKEK